MKSKLNMLAAYATIGLMSDAFTSSGDSGDEVFENLSRSKKQIIPKGCQEYTIQGITVTALSHKRALAKANKILKQQL